MGCKARHCQVSNETDSQGQVADLTAKGRNNVHLIRDLGQPYGAPATEGSPVEASEDVSAWRAVEPRRLARRQVHVDLLTSTPFDLQEQLMATRGNIEGAGLTRAQATDDLPVEDNLVRAQMISEPSELALYFD